jgi:addiction module HigA family antidote
MHNPPHPGMLLKEFMAGHSVAKIAKHLRIARGTLTRILQGKSRVKSEMALRLSEAFGLRAEVWLSLQYKRDLLVSC